MSLRPVTLNVFLASSLLLGGQHAAGVASVQAQPADDRVRELIEQASLRLGQGDPSARRFDLTVDDAVARALDRNLDIAVQRLVPQVFDLNLAEQLAFYRPTLSSTFSSTASTTPVRDAARRRSQRPDRHGAVRLVGGATGAVGRRNARHLVEQHPPGDHQLLLELQSELPEQRERELHSAAPARVRHRPGAPAARGHAGQPGDLRRRPPRDGHQHAGERPRRLLGVRVHGADGRGPAAGAGAGRAARSGQPGTRRDRHARADRHRPGAIRGGRPPPDARAGGAGSPDGGDQPQAADRERNRATSCGPPP